MHISGPIKEFRAILDRALAMKSMVQFVFPNHVIIVSSQGEYVYFRTGLFISHTTVLLVEAIQNLQRFFRKAQYLRTRDIDSLFYRLLFESVKITEDTVEFDNNPDFAFELTTTFHPIPDATELAEKIRNISMTSLIPGRPYLKIKLSVLRKTYLQIKPNGLILLERHTHQSLNYFWLKGHELLYERDQRVDQKRLARSTERLTFTRDFTVLRDFESKRFPIYDIDMVSIRRISREVPIETVVILPFENFYILEAHGESLIYKTHMRIREKSDVLANK